jgi:hypothetical protein
MLVKFERKKFAHFVFSTNDPKILSGLKAIFAMVNDPDLILRHLQALEVDVVK